MYVSLSPPVLTAFHASGLATASNLLNTICWPLFHLALGLAILQRAGKRLQCHNVYVKQLYVCCPWLNEDFKFARRASRVAERRWRKNPIDIKQQLLNSARNRLNDLVENAKSSYLQKLIADSGSDQSTLFCLVNNLLSRSKALRLSHHNSRIDLLNKFSSFFLSKVTEIRRQLDLDPLQAESYSEPVTDVPAFDSFVPVSVSDITERILASSNKSNSLDPIRFENFMKKRFIN